MSVQSAKVTGTWNGRETWGSGRSRTVEYQIICDDVDDGPSTIYDHFNASGTLPGIGANYNHGNDVDSTLFLQSMSFTRERSASPDNAAATNKPEIPFKGTLEYTELSESEVGEDETGAVKQNPLEWRDRLEIGYAERTVDAWDGYFLGVAHGRDDAGRVHMGLGDGGAAPFKPISTDKRTSVIASNGQPFDPPPLKSLNDLVIRYTTNSSTYDATWSTYYNSVNNKTVEMSSAFYGVDFTFAPYTLRVADIGGAFRFVNGSRFWEMTFEYQYRKQRWSEMILDQGTMLAAADGAIDGFGGKIVIDSQLAGAIPTVVKLREPAGQNKPQRDTIPGPILLNGKGQAIEANVANDRRKSYWLEYLFYEPASLENLPGITVP